MKLVYKALVVKQFKKINPKDLKKIRPKILVLVENPLLGKPLRGKFKGLRSMRAWPLRVIYRVDIKRKVVEIIDVDYRGGVYKK